jgi:hypothetical protein
LKELEFALDGFRAAVPPDYVPRFLQEWYIIAMEQCILRTLDALVEPQKDKYTTHSITGTAETITWSKSAETQQNSVLSMLVELREGLEKIFGMSQEKSREIRVALFATEVEAALEDHLLSQQEEWGMQALMAVLGLSAEDVGAELQVLQIAGNLRRQMEQYLQAVDSPVSLLRGETAYAVFDPVRLLNERVLNRYQKDQVQYRELGYEAELEGSLVVTERRLIFVGREAGQNSDSASGGVARNTSGNITGANRENATVRVPPGSSDRNHGRFSGQSAMRTREYRLNRLADVITDPARNLLELVFTDRKSPVTLTGPECVVMGAKIEQVRQITDS